MRTSLAARRSVTSLLYPLSVAGVEVRAPGGCSDCLYAPQARLYGLPCLFLPNGAFGSTPGAHDLSVVTRFCPLFAFAGFGFGTFAGAAATTLAFFDALSGM